MRAAAEAGEGGEWDLASCGALGDLVGLLRVRGHAGGGEAREDLIPPAVARHLTTRSGERRRLRLQRRRHY